jgi:putative transposase
VAKDHGVLAPHRARPTEAERLHRVINGRIRDELFNESRFIDLGQAGWRSAAWVADYNTARPHSSPGYKTLAAYAGTLTAPKGVTSVEAVIAAG